jgi:hypothetical protein
MPTLTLGLHIEFDEVKLGLMEIFGYVRYAAVCRCFRK